MASFDPESPQIRKAVSEAVEQVKAAIEKLPEISISVLTDDRFPEPPNETREERHQRYCEAANHGVDIGPDKEFIQYLLRGDHLRDGNFLKGI